VETICLKCLAKKPADRYDSARDLADDLGRFLEGRPIMARPASLAERGVKFVKRNRLLVGSASALFLVLCLGMALRDQQARRAVRAERLAQEEAKVASRALTRFHTRAATTFAQRGQLKEALESYQKALDGGHPKTSQLRLDMARVHAALYQIDEADKLLEQVLNDPDAKELHASALLLKSYTTLGPKLNEGLEGVRKARAMGLPKAEDAFARGMLAETSPAAVEHLGQALEADPTHHPSRVMLGMLLILMGRIRDAEKLADTSRALYPDDPNFELMSALILTLQGQRDKAEQIARRLDKQFTPRQARALRLTIELFDAAGRLDEPEESRSGRKIESVWRDLQPELPTVWPVLEGKVATTPEQGSGQLLQIPPVVNRSLVDMMKGLGGVILGTADEDKLKSALKKHPEGTLHFVCGSVLVQKNRFTEARAQFVAACSTPGIGQVKRSSLRAILMCDLERAVKGKQVDGSILRQSMPFVRELLALGALRPDEYDICVRVCVHSEELDQARKIIKDWEDRFGRDEPRVARWRMRAEAQAGNHSGAIESADRILVRDPNNADAKKIRTEAVRDLGKLMRKTGGSP
jgi:tetratricopeptide (TPR) repeat protein